LSVYACVLSIYIILKRKVSRAPHTHTHICMYIYVCVRERERVSVCVCNMYRTHRYREELEPALKGVSFETSAGEKIGIVGRTAAISQKSLYLS